MRNLEGIKIVEVPEKEIESSSIRVSDIDTPDDYENFRLIEKDKLLKLKEQLEEAQFYDSCVPKAQVEEEYKSENYDDCGKKSM